MFANNLRAAAAAFLLGTATIAGAAVLTTTAAEAAVRAVVGKPLTEARNLAASGNYSAAMGKVHEAEGAGGLTSEERSIINQMKEYISVKSGSVGEVTSALGARAKFAADYSAGRYGAVIADGDILRKYGALDGNSMQVIAQAYYLSGNKSGCVRYIRNNFGGGAGESLLQLQMRCAYDAGDNDAQRDALESLVGRTGKAEYWGLLLRATSNTPGIDDHGKLDVYRIKLLTNSISSADDYILLSQLALQFGCFDEAQQVEQKGVAAKVLTGDRAMRLVNMTTGLATQARAAAAKNVADANKAASGDALVKLGEGMTATKAKDAIDTIQSGIKKGVSDKNNAQMRLGVAYLTSGDKSSATHAFAQVKGNPKQEMIAHLWSLYAHR